MLHRGMKFFLKEVCTTEVQTSVYLRVCKLYVYELQKKMISVLTDKMFSLNK